MKYRPLTLCLFTASLVLLGCGQDAEVERIYPEDVYDTKSIGFTQVITSRGGKHVFVAGSIAYDKDRNLVGEGDVGAQLEQSLKNVRLSLAAAGATPDDVVRMRIFIVGYKAEYRPLVGKALAGFYTSDKRATSTLIGVQALALDELLVEVDATAVVD